MATIAKLYPILKELGLDDLKANEFVEIIDQSRKEDLATKADLKDLEIRLVKWIIGLMIVQTSITIALLKLFWPFSRKGSNWFSPSSIFPPN